jgi:hypothetical protein
MKKPAVQRNTNQPSITSVKTDDALDAMSRSFSSGHVSLQRDWFSRSTAVRLLSSKASAVEMAIAGKKTDGEEEGTNGTKQSAPTNICRD